MPSNYEEGHVGKGKDETGVVVNSEEDHLEELDRVRRRKLYE